MKPAADVLQALLLAEKRAVLHRWVTDQMNLGGATTASGERVLPPLVGYSSEFLDHFLQDVGTGDCFHSQMWLEALIDESMLDEISASALTQFLLTLKKALSQLWVREAWNRHAPSPGTAERDQDASAIVEWTALLDSLALLDDIHWRAVRALERRRASDPALDIDSLELYEERRRQSQQSQAEVRRLLDSFELADSIDSLESVELKPAVLPPLGGMRNMAGELRRRQASLEAQPGGTDADISGDYDTSEGAAAGCEPGQPAASQQGMPEDAPTVSRKQEVVDAPSLLGTGRSDDLALLDLSELIWQLGEQYGPQAAQRGLALSVQQPPTPVWVVSRRLSLQALIGNLLAKAIAATPTGLVTLAAVETHVEERGRPDPAGRKVVCVEVADEGTGLEDDICRWLEGAHAEQVTVAGLGFLIVRDLATRLAVDLKAGRPDKGGTRFVLTLPVQEAT